MVEAMGMITLLGREQRKNYAGLRWSPSYRQGRGSSGSRYNVGNSFPPGSRVKMEMGQCFRHQSIVSVDERGGREGRAVGKLPRFDDLDIIWLSLTFRVEMLSS